MVALVIRVVNRQVQQKSAEFLDHLNDYHVFKGTVIDLILSLCTSGSQSVGRPPLGGCMMSSRGAQEVRKYFISLNK
jgi:hypothetical protein